MMKNIKKPIYIFFCAFLGLFLGFIVHAIIEQIVIAFLVVDFDAYGLGLSWEMWFLIHKFFTIVTILGGVVFGIWLGFRWYRIVYEEGRGGFVAHVHGYLSKKQLFF